MNKERIYLDNDDVLRFESSQGLSLGTTFTGDQLKDWLTQRLGGSSNANAAFVDGIVGKYLSAKDGGGWKTAKIQLCIEVEINESYSEIDEIQS